jgi:hypothetical protein
MSKYTKEIHAQRLIELLKLSEDKYSYSCPACVGFNAGMRFLFEKGTTDYLYDARNPYCEVCQEFVDMPAGTEACPCDHYGTAKAIELTRKKLKEGGYLG